MRHAATLLLALALSACAYPQYVNDEYRHIPLTIFAHDNRSYRIFDKPSVGKLVATPSLSMAVSDNVVRTVTFDRYHNKTAPEKIEAAVAAYLMSNRRKCVITGGAQVYDPQWEFTYNCEITTTAYP